MSMGVNFILIFNRLEENLVRLSSRNTHTTLPVLYIAIRTLVGVSKQPLRVRNAASNQLTRRRPSCRAWSGVDVAASLCATVKNDARFLKACTCHCPSCRGAGLGRAERGHVSAELGARRVVRPRRRRSV
ncbi:hypothetical protein EVAR_103710_1 [Eumeta japonica]|uniref:Uncharacterized protein n=1 Tax=Eumeta variegata TaxID=151549 RepID=A0A4C1ZKU8_EUMVA|nr:hypothetical protein EVAR_103710_1 [Eumeta japonica]